MTAAPSPAPLLAPPPPPQKKLSGCAIAGIGCGVLALLLMLGCVIAIWWAVSNWQTLAASLGTYGVTQMVEASDLPPDQKTRIVARLNQVNTDFQEGRITGEQLGRVVEAVMQTPLLHVGLVMLAEQKYLVPNTELTAEEKQAGRRSLERFARGVYEQKLPQDAVDRVMAPIMTTDGAGGRDVKENPTTDEVREMLRLANEAANEVEVPDEPFEVDIATELDRAVDQALAAPPTEASDAAAVPQDASSD